MTKENCEKYLKIYEDRKDWKNVEKTKRALAMYERVIKV